MAKSNGTASVGLPLLGALALLLGVDAGLDVLELSRLEGTDHRDLKCLRRWHNELGRGLEEREGLALGALRCGLAALLEQVHRGAAALYRDVSAGLTYWR